MKKYVLFSILLICPMLSHASEFLQQSEFDVAQSEIKYSLMNNQVSEQKFQADDEGEISYSSGKSEKDFKLKSPGKAFAMSLLVPGLGQNYTGGSKLKSLAFLGTEIASWVLYFKWESDADDLTGAYEAFNDAHWSESRYDDMLLWTYGLTDDEQSTGQITEISHHLPDTKTQQYYEMTGKYDQFAWGWNDAVLLSDSSTYENYSLNNPFPAIFGAENIPYSANRNLYETMRNDANNKYDQARKMIYVSMLNRLFSAFEAMISAKNYNKTVVNKSLLSTISAKVSYKSLYVKRDTPFLTLSMKF